MLDSLLQYGEVAGYYGLLGAIVLMSFWESGAPRRTLNKPIRNRWLRNFGLFVTSNLIARLAIPIFTVEAARLAGDLGWGILPKLGVPLWLNLVLGFLLLDLVRYGLHWASHRYLILWRIHRVHHTDQEFDFTTSLRNHPIELPVITLLSVAVIVVFGIHPLAVILTEVIALVINTINHGNVRINTRLDQLLRRVVVTPDMHRVHHSSLPREFNANLGGLLTWWDRLFGTYVAQPRLGHEAMSIGLPGYTRDDGGKFLSLLLDPFTSPSAEFKAPNSQPQNSSQVSHL